MAEKVKRRVAAARLAVAFVAAGTIAGATASARPSPPATGTPSSDAHASALNAYLKIKGLTGDNILDGSLLFKDFHKGEVPSERQFIKMQNNLRNFQKVVFRKYYPKVEIDRNFIKGESSDYLKVADADARYIKLDSSVMHGDGSVLTASKLVPAVQKVTLLEVPSMFTVDAQGPTIEITNTSGAPLIYSDCGEPSGEPPSGGTLEPGASLQCKAGGASSSLQLISGDTKPTVATLNFSAISVQGGTQSTVQILIGL